MLACLLVEALRRFQRHDVTVLSAGVAARAGAPASPEAVAAMARRGLDLSGHRSQAATDLDLTAFDQLWCLGPSHARAALAAGVEANRIRVCLAAEGGVPDPFGGDAALYEATARSLERAVATIIDQLPDHSQ